MRWERSGSETESRKCHVIISPFPRFHIGSFPHFLLLILAAVTGCHCANPAETSRALIDAAKNADRVEVAKLLDSGADIESRNESGRTVLMLTALRGNSQIVATLLDHGADVRASDPDGMTPLMWAAFGGSGPTVKVLLSRGAEINTKNKKGETALTWARARGSNRAVIDELLKKGARD